MPSLGNESGYAVVTIFTALTLLLPIAAVVTPSQSSLASEYAPVIGTKQKYLLGQNAYIFMHNSSLVFEAPQESDWTFDHVEVNFGCEVGGVAGSNVSNVFAIDNGYIQECRVG